MKHAILLFLMVMFLNFPTLVVAHGITVPVLRTVTECTPERIVVRTPKGESVTLMNQDKTIFQHNDMKTNAARRSVGDRVMAEAENEADYLVDQEVRFATPKSK